MNAEQRCIICGGSKFKPRFPAHKGGRAERGSTYRITRSTRSLVPHILVCTTCGLTFLPTQWAAGIERYVDAVDAEFARQKTQRLRNASLLLAELEGLKPGSRLLEIGCACGFLLKVARDQFGFEVCGVEPSRWAVEYANQHFGLHVQNGYIESVKFRNEFFDAIILADVIEHLENPKQVLEQLYKICKARGQLLIVTPDIDSLMARLAGRYWWGLLDDHNFYFSKKTIALLLEKCGFTLIAAESFGRTFLLADWIIKLEQYGTSLHRLMDAVTRVLRVQSIPLYLNLGDQMVCRAIKNV